MRIVITQPDENTPLGWVEVDLSQYNFRGRDRRRHAQLSVFFEEEWKFRFDKLLAAQGIMRFGPWETTRNPNPFTRHYVYTIQYRAAVRLDTK